MVEAIFALSGAGVPPKHALPRPRVGDERVAHAHTESLELTRRRAALVQSCPGGVVI